MHSGGVPLRCHHPGTMLSGEVALNGVTVATGSAPPQIMRSQMVPPPWWLLVWGCRSSGGEKSCLASCWYLLGATGSNWSAGEARLGCAITSQPRSCNYPSRPPASPLLSLISRIWTDDAASPTDDAGQQLGETHQAEAVTRLRVALTGPWRPGEFPRRQQGLDQRLGYLFFPPSALSAFILTINC